VVDVGCGIGTWLSVFQQHGVSDVLGLDGKYVESRLEIPLESFQPWDLEHPISVARCFDLAVCLEVAEHISVARADTFIDDLVHLAPIVLFSAAAPLQGGVGHVNEQWPTYWVQKFAARGLSVVDAIRPAVWDNDRVAMWYAQNCLIFATQEALALHAILDARKRPTNLHQLNLIHPSLFLYHRLGLEEPTSRVALDAAGGMVANGDESALAPPTGDRQSTASAEWASTGGVARPIGLRELLHKLPAATRRAVSARIQRSKRR